MGRARNGRGAPHASTCSDQRRNVRIDGHLDHQRAGAGKALLHPGLEGVEVGDALGRAAIALGEADNVDAGNVEPGDTGCFLQNGEGFQDSIFAIAQHDEDDGQLMLRGGPQGLY